MAAAVVLVAALGFVVLCVEIWPHLANEGTAVAATATAGIVAATGGVLSGFAGAVAAVAAYRAARESRATARDATEALGLAMEPTLTSSRASRPWWSRTPRGGEPPTSCLKRSLRMDAALPVGSTSCQQSQTRTPGRA